MVLFFENRAIIGEVVIPKFLRAFDNFLSKISFVKSIKNFLLLFCSYGSPLKHLILTLLRSRLLSRGGTIELTSEALCI